MTKLRQLFKRSTSAEHIAPFDDSGNQSDAASDSQVVEPKKTSRPRNKLHRRSRSEDSTTNMAQKTKSSESHADEAAVTLSPRPKDENEEEEALSNACKALGEQIENQIAGKRTSSQARYAASSKTSWTAAKRLLGEQLDNSTHRTQSQAKQAAAAKTFSAPPKNTDSNALSDAAKAEDSVVTYRLPHGRKKPSDRQTDSVSPCQPIPDITKINTPVTAYLPPDQARAVIAAQRPGEQASVLTLEAYSPAESSSPATKSSPGTSAVPSSSSSSSPSLGTAKGKARNGPATCTYQASTKTSLGVSYVAWIRWRCCGCRHETHWEGEICSKLDCSHLKCRVCEKLAR